ncbi:DUF6491 family protein [Xanthomonas maliensis]|uniref:DUF6491 family protein n=1 Tax=Xanthomonas maliensis TaxID=1321368 RepID=UPI00039E28A2|nr:DUF6491 family protein [Xanthomonas maliensis]KAB7764035.1 hypothetical protein CKY51_18190 [Xanthomonas maliensis]
MFKCAGVVLCVLVLLTACASVRLSDVERAQLYRTQAGEPVKAFRYQGTLTGWTALGDSALAVWTRPNEAYLLELRGNCPELPYAQAIAVTQRFGQVSARLDDVIVLGRPTVVRLPCRIETIRPLDAKAIRQAEQQRRAVSLRERRSEDGD